MDRWGPQQSNRALGAPAEQRGLCLQKPPVGGGYEAVDKVGRGDKGEGGGTPSALGSNRFGMT